MIGITGGIGSGKTTVCRIFEVLGAKVYYADDRAKWLMEHDEELVSEIEKLFGSAAYQNGQLNRKVIAAQIYKDDTLREKLNRLVHPVVGEDALQWERENQGHPLLVKEAALLFETGSYKQLDYTLLVTAPDEVRVARVVARDSHRSPEDVKAIISKQMSDSEKRPLADYEIINDGKHSLIQQVMGIFQKLVIA